jgi:HK97 family phage prohead protease
MSDYDSLAQRREKEDAQRGYSIGGVGWIRSADGKDVPPPIFEERTTVLKGIEPHDDDTVIMGYALLWNKIVENRGKYILVREDAFTELQCGKEIFFQHNHDDNIRVASTKNNLVLYADDIGLAFKLFIPNTALGKQTRDLVRSNAKSAMSASFVGTDIEKRMVEGVEVHIVNKGELFEISLVTAGACGPAFAALIRKDRCGTLFEDCASLRMKSELHFAAMMRASRKLMALCS